MLKKKEEKSSKYKRKKDNKNLDGYCQKMDKQ